jgi:hypothetical protein
MSDCKYCKLDEYVGEKFDTCKFIDGSDQLFEMWLFDSPEDECKVLQLDGTHTDVRVPIKYCPFCGRKL